MQGVASAAAQTRLPPPPSVPASAAPMLSPLRSARAAARALMRARATTASASSSPSAAGSGPRAAMMMAMAAPPTTTPPTPLLARRLAAAASSSSPASSHHLLSFRTSAAAPVSDAAVEDQQQQQQQKKQKNKGGKGGGGKGKGEDEPPADGMTLAELAAIDLPTSDESEDLLRVRHTVSSSCWEWWCCRGGGEREREAGREKKTQRRSRQPRDPAHPNQKKRRKKTRKTPTKTQQCAHLMAMAVQKLYPKAQVTIGPWIDRGFYYDFDTRNVESGPLTEPDLKKIRREMQRLVRRNLPLRREDLGSADEARKRIQAANEPYKLEILDGILARDPEAEVTIYHVGEDDDPDHWWDLCAGPHVASTGKIHPEAFEVESLAGAYWRGDNARPMLQRVYGTAWETPDQLKAYARLKQEAARRDHRKLGQELDLFSLRPDSAGGGLVFWHPRGAAVRSVIEDYWRNLHARRGYELVYSPHIARADLWRTSGHLDFYGDSMFNRILVDDGETTSEGAGSEAATTAPSNGASSSSSHKTLDPNDPLAATQADNKLVGTEYQLKPMNCPFHVEIYRDRPRSYRELPLRWAELGTVYRYEQSGALHGLFRVRGFTQDDAHVFCLPNQVATEIKAVLDLIEEILSAFGFTQYEINLSTRPEQSVGGDDVWQLAEKALVEALDAKGWSYAIDEGGGAFYGPKIDLKIQDAIGRKWQCSTVQLDFNLPERFGLSYVDADNTPQRPIMIHRAIFGSIERFFGILVENYAGAFPLWLAPVQVRLLPVNDAVAEYAKKVAEQLSEEGVRVEVMERASIAKMIRTAERAKTPVMCVVGQREADNGELSVRLYGGADLGTHKAGEVVAAVGRASRGRKGTLEM